MHLIENGINEQTAKRIQTLLDKDGPFDEIIAHLKNFTKSKTEVNHHLYEDCTHLYVYLFLCRDLNY